MNRHWRGGYRVLRPCFAAVLPLAGFVLAVSAQAQDSAGRDCAPAGFIESSVGVVTVRTESAVAVAVSRNLLLCSGDEVTTGPNARVGIRSATSRTAIRLYRNTKAVVRDPAGAEPAVSLLQGILYFISSTREDFAIETPFIVAGIEGTEALAGVDGEREIVAVREGLLGAYDRTRGPATKEPVAVDEAAYRSNSVPFDVAAIDDLPPGFRELLIVSDSSVDWAVYYPPIMFVEPGRRDAGVNRAIELLRSGNYEGAIAALDGARAGAPAESAALRTIIAIARNRLDEAAGFADLALQANPDFAPAHVAASYVDQAVGDLDSALDRAYEAARIAPDDAYVIARLAELQMIVGDRRGALRSAEWSLGIEPTALALFVEGLARLAAWQYATAEQLFAEAIALDQESPLPRLGLGLALVRQGKIADGAWQMELAVAHDPKRASLRNWLGRAYYDEGLEDKAVEQFALAKQDDPEDPTPYLFSALERYAANDPIGALEELQGAEDRGGARAVLRSARGLGEDTATIGAALGRVYDVLGFDQLAINAGAAAVDADPANPGAHRFLADAYRQRPDTKVAQTSELLRSQLLSPPSSTPVQPELAEARLALLDTTGPTRVTFAEFAPLFDSDGLRFDLSGLYGTQETWGAEGAVTGLYRNFSLSVGGFHYETDGYRPNNDLTHDIFDAVSTIAFSPEFSVFSEYRYRESEGGDRRLNFDSGSGPFGFDPTFRSEETQELARVGFHAEPTENSDFIGVYTWAHLLRDDSMGDFISITTIDDNESNSGQAQYSWVDGRLHSVIGAAYFENNRQLEVESLFGSSITSLDSEYTNGYGYFDFDLIDQLTLTAGGAVVSYKQSGPGPNVLEFYPKVGATARLNDYVTLRAAYFRNLKPDFVSDQVIEPTAIAGFNQFFDAEDGSVAEQVGGGIDIKLSDRVWIGAEAIGRWWDVPTLEVFGSDYFESTEQVYRGYAYVTLSDSFALSAEILYEDLATTVPSDFETWKTLSVPVTLSYFSDTGFFGSIGIEYVDHSFSDPGNSGEDQFTLVNAGLGYRLPRNAGVLTLEVQNLFDTSFSFQNRSLRPDLIVTPRYAPERTILARGTVQF